MVQTVFSRGANRSLYLCNQKTLSPLFSQREPPVLGTPPNCQTLKDQNLEVRGEDFPTKKIGFRYRLNSKKWGKIGVLLENSVCTLAWCEWRAAAPGPLRLPRAPSPPALDSFGRRPLFLTTKSFMGFPPPLSFTLTALSVGT